MEKNSPVLRVLVVDDDPLTRWSIAESLKQAGHVVHEAADRASAIRALGGSSQLFDVILLDYYMPDSNDLTLLATIRRLAPGSAVVVMTAYGTPEITEGALQHGARQVLNKPFDMHEIAAVVLRAYVTRPH